MNTAFQKPDHKLITWKYPGTKHFNNVSRPHFEMIDYHCTISRWKNTVMNVETDMYANITSDHFPQRSTIKTKLKAITKQETARPKYLKCTEEQNHQFNRMLTQKQTHHALAFLQQMNQAAECHIPMVKTPARKEDISQESLAIIQNRERAAIRGDEEDMAALTHALRVQRRKDKQKRIEAELSTKLDVRDWWATIKQVRKPFTSTTYALKDRQGKRIK